MKESSVSKAMEEEHKLTNSLEFVVNLAKMETTGGARVLASFLLSVYNGQRFPFSLSDMVLLDERCFNHALNILHLRRTTGMEPHEFFDKGNELFEGIAKRWELGEYADKKKR